MNDRCPSCKHKVIFARKKLVDCPNCKKKLLLVKINGKNKIMDVSPRKDLKI